MNFIYNFVMLFLAIMGSPVWIPLVMTSEKRRKPFFRRLFMEPLPNDLPDDGEKGETVWIHALSVGEVLSAELLVKKMAQEKKALSLIFTASTNTGFEVANRFIRPYVNAVRYFPYDTIFSINRALRIISPQRVVVVETDIWPNFLNVLKKRCIPAYLVNARLSDRSYKSYMRIRDVMAPVFSVFTKICVQTQIDGKRFSNLGVPYGRITVVGNMKSDQEPVSVSDEEIHALAGQLNIRSGRRIWIAGSTHDGEETVLADAFNRILKSGIKPVLIVVPRDPGRADGVCKVFRADDLVVGKISDFPRRQQQRSADVVVVDQIGILRKLYALADVAFVGGSLVKAGGHNPLEPASVAKPVLFGPHTDDFRWISAMLENAGGGIRVTTGENLASQVLSLLVDKKKAFEVGQKAYRVFSDNRGAVEQTMRVIQ